MLKVKGERQELQTPFEYTQPNCFYLHVFVASRK